MVLLTWLIMQVVSNKHGYHLSLKSVFVNYEIQTGDNFDAPLTPTTLQ